ncbi:MAG: DUF2283 domain-containing protein [Pseudomonadota bacterium]
MKAKYFRDTDTLYIEFRAGDIVETRDLDEDTVIELDANGNICAMTMEHAKDRTDALHFTFEEVAA